jgi:hypothetical protein
MKNVAALLLASPVLLVYYLHVLLWRRPSKEQLLWLWAHGTVDELQATRTFARTSGQRPIVALTSTGPDPGRRQVPIDFGRRTSGRSIAF